MSNAVFTPGQTVYSAEGYEFEFVGTLGGINFVRDVYEEDYEGYANFEPRAYRGPLFERAPKQKRDEELAAAQERLKAIRDEEYALRRSISDLKAEQEAAAAKHRSFALLLDYLEGKITHVVVPRTSYGTGIQIRPFDDAFLMKAEREYHYSSREETWPRAIGLFSVPNPCEGKGTKYDRRKITWKAAEYHSGGDDWTKFIPCRSEEEARTVITRLVAKRLDAWRADSTKAREVREFIEGNDWLALPEDWLEHEARLQAESVAKRQQDLKKKRAQLETELAALAEEAAGV